MAKNVSPCTFVCTAHLVYHASASNNSLQALLGSTCPCTSSPSLKCPGGTFPLVHRSPLPDFPERIQDVTLENAILETYYSPSFDMFLIAFQLTEDLFALSPSLHPKYNSYSCLMFSVILRWYSLW